MRFVRYMVGSSLFLLVVLGFALPGHAGKFNKIVDPGAAMPEFANLPAVDGKTLSSGDLKESVVVLVFLANHCPWVRGMDGDLVNLAAHFAGKDVRIVGVSVNHREDDRPEAMKAHAARAGYNFTYVYDESQELGRRLGATRTPEYFVFNKQRRLVYMGALHNSPASMRTDGTINYTKGEPTEFYVRDAIEAALAGRPAPVDETRPQGCTIEYAQAK